MRVQVFVYAEPGDLYDHDSTFLHSYVMDHNDSAQRRVLGEQCRNAFEGGQVIVTYPLGDSRG